MKKKFDEEKAALVQSTDYTIVDLTQRLGKAEADLAIVKNKNALRINTNRKLKK